MAKPLDLASVPFSRFGSYIAFNWLDDQDIPGSVA